jgi:hypothetical protein
MLGSRHEAAPPTAVLLGRAESFFVSETNLGIIAPVIDAWRNLPPQ